MRRLLFVSLAVAMLLFGCAGNPPAQQPPAAGGQQQAPSGSAGSGGSQPSADNSGGSQATPPSPPSPPEAMPQDSNTANELLSLLGLNSGWRVTYALSGTSIPAGSEMTQYIKGTDKVRVDSLTMGMQIRTFVLSSVVYSCTSQGGSWTCYKMSQGSPDSEPLQKGLKSNPSKYTVTLDGTMQVAGATAKCYRVVSEGSTMRYCVSPEGIPLYVKTTGSKDGVASESELTATSYSASVSDSDFTLPAAVQEPGAGMGGGASGGASGGAGASGGTCSYCGYLPDSERAQCFASCGG